MKTRLSYLWTALLFGGLGVSAEGSGPLGPDADGDGVVTLAEFQDFRIARAFANDADGDGGLSLEEFRPMLPARVPRMMHGRAFGRIDSDGDGVLVRDELAATPARAFEAADADGDGQLTREELEQLRIP